MKTSFKKLVAGASITALVIMNTAYATQIGTWTITWSWTTPINSTWDWVSTASGTTASGSLDVLVSAQVIPTLSMTISTWALNFWVLSVWANNQSLTVTTASNAKDWVTVSVASTWLATWNGATDKYIWTLARGWSQTTTWVDSYKIASVDTSVSGGTVLWLQDVAGSQTILNANNVAKANATTTVNLTATIDAQTEAGNYNDTLTFTVVGTF